MSLWKKTKSNLYLAHTKKIHFKVIIGLNSGAKTLKNLGENIGKNLCDTGVGKDFLNRTQKAQYMKEKIDKPLLFLNHILIIPSLIGF